jgi:hypothetical protein
MLAAPQSRQKLPLILPSTPEMTRRLNPGEILQQLHNNPSQKADPLRVLDELQNLDRLRSAESSDTKRFFSRLKFTTGQNS